MTQREREEGNADPLAPSRDSWPHKSRKLPEKPHNWDQLSDEAKRKWEDFRNWYRDQLDDEDRGKLRRRHGY